MTFTHRIGFLGCPSQPDLPWNLENIRRLVNLGFNTIQLNIAWGARPGDEPLNLEDVVDIRESAAEGVQQLPLRSGTTCAQIERRRANLRERLVLCQEAKLRTVFHFGAPYNMHLKFGDNPPNCLSDEKTQKFYCDLLETFARQYPGVDDLLLYTYDQDAWLCSEFGECPRCIGRPLHERVSGFVNRLAQTWKRLNADGRLWWEPWELSAGQVLHTVGCLDASCVGLMLHSNIAEVMATMPVDRWLRNTVTVARGAKIPVVVEHFLGGPTEEVEPFRYLSWPLVTLRALRSIHALEVDGIKEYYGLLPDKEDPNLRMTGIFFNQPEISDNEALRQLAESYGDCANEAGAFWRAASEAMDLFPWNASWWIREVGKCEPVHSMGAAFIRGQQAHTPSWESTRRCIFMKTDDGEADSWMLEDVELQCRLTTEKIGEALTIGERIADRIPAGVRDDFAKGLAEFRELRQRVLSYVFHIRETNLTRIMRQCLERKHEFPAHVLGELKECLEADAKNQGQDEPCRSALGLLEKDPVQFVNTYFLPGLSGWLREEEESGQRFSVTSQ